MGLNFKIIVQFATGVDFSASLPLFCRQTSRFFIKGMATIFIPVLMITNCSAQSQANNSSDIKKAPWFVEKFRVSGGFFVPTSNTNLQVGIKGGAVGTEIDFEKDLGFTKSQLTYLANFQWRITRRSRLNLNYYNIPRKSTHTIDRDITFDGQTYPVNATVNSFFNTAIYQITYGYAVLAKPDYELGLLIGTHLVDGTAGMAINSGLGTISGSTNFSFIAPLPDLGIWGGYAFNDRLAVNFDLTYLALAVGDISGRIFAYNLLFIYKLGERLNLSLGYSGLNFRVDVNKTNADGHFKWGYDGPALGVSYVFGKKPWSH